MPRIDRSNTGFPVSTHSLLALDETRVPTRKIVTQRGGQMGRAIAPSEFAAAAARLPTREATDRALGAYAALSAAESLRARTDQDYYIVGPSAPIAAKKLIRKIQEAIDATETWKGAPPVLTKHVIDAVPDDPATSDVALFFNVDTQDEEKLAKLVDSFNRYDY